MNILFVTLSLPHARARHGGGQLGYEWLRHLSRRHSLFLVTILPEEDRPFLPEARGLFREVRTVPVYRGALSRLRRLPLLARYPYAVVTYSAPEIRDGISDLVARRGIDLVQMEHLPLGQYAAGLPAGLPRVLLFQDVASSVLRQQVRIAGGMRKWLLYREWDRSRYWEKRYAADAGNVFVLSRKDQRVVESWDVGARCAVLPPLFGEGFFDPPGGETEAGSVLFVGAMHRWVNVDAARVLKEKIMPLVARECPGARATVVGDRPPESLRALAAPDFRVVGAVESLGPFLGRAAVFAAPLRVAGGVIVKVLQAMAAGKPVVTTRAANAGIGAEEEREILVADRPEDFARKVIGLLRDRARAAAVGEAGRRFVRNRCDPERSRRRIDEIYAAAGRR